jgi:hypothetical protein
MEVASLRTSVSVCNDTNRYLSTSASSWQRISLTPDHLPTPCCCVLISLVIVGSLFGIRSNLSATESDTRYLNGGSRE